MQKKALRADGMLLLTSVVWGLAFVAQRVGMEHIGPFAFNGIRFALGSLSLLPLIRFSEDAIDCRHRGRDLQRETLGPAPLYPAPLGPASLRPRRCKRTNGGFF